MAHLEMMVFLACQVLEVNQDSLALMENLVRKHSYTICYALITVDSGSDF